MRIYSKNIPAKFHPNPIWIDGTLGFFEDGCPNDKKNKMSSDGIIRSVPDQKSREEQLDKSLQWPASMHVTWRHSRKNEFNEKACNKHA